MDSTHRVFFLLMFLALFIVAQFWYGPPKKRGDVGIDAGGGGGSGGGDSGGGFGGDCGGGGGDGDACGGGGGH